jgi:hypothetical protein
VRIPVSEVASRGGRTRGPGNIREEAHVLWTILVILLILWLLGYTVLNIGALIHVLLIIALAVLIYQLITGRRVV